MHEYTPAPPGGLMATLPKSKDPTEPEPEPEPELEPEPEPELCSH
jgi:hypothetical protein